jgi:protein gp37
MFEMDRSIGVNSNHIKQNRTDFRLPVRKVREKNKKLEKYELQYKVPSGSTIMTCLTSDFFIEEADAMRVDAWNYIHERQDCLFHIITKRPGRILQTLPDLWLDGWNNVMVSVTAENDYRAWERIPILLNLPIKHKGIVIEPMLEELDIRPFLSSGEIENVSVGGESYLGYDGLARPLKLSWVKSIQEQCKEYNTNFQFHQTGSRLMLDNGQIVKVNKRDEHGLADFYKLNYIDESYVEWETTAKELELQSLAENAHKIYKQLTLEDFGIK